ncbi:unnamed protein product [Calypogeia fissa]
MKMAIAVGSMMLLVMGCFNAAVQGTDLWLFSRPDPDNAPAMARWLVSSNSWGVLSTISVHLGGTPWGNIASFSDGPVGAGTGRPYFYLSGLDPTPVDLEHDSRCSLTMSEFPLGTCGDKDAENPTCARLTLSGKIVEITKDDVEAAFATQALFSKHPEMEGWPKGHDWRIFKLDIEDLFLVDYYGGARPLPVKDYYNITGFTSF